MKFQSKTKIKIQKNSIGLSNNKKNYRGINNNKKKYKMSKLICEEKKYNKSLFLNHLFNIIFLNKLKLFYLLFLF